MLLAVFTAKGDTKYCDLLLCPFNCATVRVSREEGCVYCQCGPVLAPGDQLVPIGRQCPPTSLPGPIQPDTRVCRAPTREGEAVWYCHLGL